MCGVVWCNGELPAWLTTSPGCRVVDRDANWPTDRSPCLPNRLIDPATRPHSPFPFFHHQAPGAQNPFFRDLEQQENADPTNPKVLTHEKINVYDILPKDKAYWHYEGSLTTPPCQKKIGRNVHWYVFQTPAQLSLPQLFFFSSYFEQLPLANNGKVNRDIQEVLDSTTLYSYP